MPTPSDNHALELDYESGEEWDYNDEMERIEEHLPVRDVESKRGDYTPYQTTEFIATDTGTVYDGDGSTWAKADRGFGEVTVDSLAGLSTDPVSNLAGNNLAVDADGNLNASLSGGTGSYTEDNVDETITGNWTFDASFTSNTELTVQSDGTTQIGTDVGNTVFTANGARHEYNAPDTGSLRIYNENTGRYELQFDSDGASFPNGVAVKDQGKITLNADDPRIRWWDDTNTAHMTMFLDVFGDGTVDFHLQDLLKSSNESVFRYLPGGTDPIDFPSGLRKHGNHVVHSPSGDYEIQVNGTDGAGIINFKT